MLRENDAVFRRILIASDMVLVFAAFYIGYALRNVLPLFYSIDSLGLLYPIPAYYKLIPVCMVLWGCSLYFFGAYDVFRSKSLPEVFWSVFKASLAAGVFFSLIAFVFQLYYVSRPFMAIVFGVTTVLIALSRFGVVSVLRRIRSRGFNFRRVLIVGTGARAQAYIDRIEAHPEWGLKVVGLLDSHPEMVGSEIKGYKVLGVLDDITNVLTSHVVDDVMFVVPRTWLPKIEFSILECEQLGKRVSVALDHFNMKFAKAKQTNLDGFPVLTFETTSDKAFELVMKRIVDIVVASAAIVVLSPVLAAVAAIVALDSPGPILFRQTRSGLNGRKFTLLKFRTMVVDAEARLAALKAFNEMSGPAFKMEKDPRVTRCGSWMRKLSIDELPQLFNVLRGDMSLVGPRPPIPAEVDQYQPWQRRRLSMPPGITCLWQVNGRNKIVDFDEWMRLDLQYIDKWSLKLDLKILAKTVPVVLFGVGAK